MTQYSFSNTSFSTPNCKKYTDIISRNNDLYWTHDDRPQSTQDLQFVHDTQFACSECNEGYYLDLETHLCVQRHTADLLCEELETNSNRCKKCKQEAFLMRVQGTCVLSPNRELNCATYNEMGLCMACTNDTYPVTVVLDSIVDRLTGSDRFTPPIIDHLNSVSTQTSTDSIESEETHKNIITSFKYECQALPAGYIKTNCTSYDKFKRCVSCANTHWLFDSRCVTITASNCAVLQDPYTCRTCPKGYQMDAPVNNGSNIVTSCSEIDLQHCQIKNLVEVNGDSASTLVKVCEKCDIGYYFKEDTRICELIPNAIENCEYYAPDQTCMFCKEKYLLSNDNTACQIKLQNYYHGDQNCSLGVIQNTPICDACKPGFYLDIDNNCKPCASQGINSVPNNCAICSPRSPNKCLMCMEGYDMNKEGFCQLRSSE